MMVITIIMWVLLVMYVSEDDVIGFIAFIVTLWLCMIVSYRYEKQHTYIPEYEENEIKILIIIGTLAAIGAIVYSIYGI